MFPPSDDVEGAWEAPPQLPSLRTASGSMAAAAPVQDGRRLRLRGEVATGLVAKPWTGWVLLLAGVGALVGTLGPWAVAGEATVNGGVLNGRWSALAAAALIALGILLVVGLGYRWICLLGFCASAITVGYGLTGYDAAAGVFSSARPAAWGIHLCVSAGIAAGVISLVAAVVRSPYSRLVDRPVRGIAGTAETWDARSEPVVGGALLFAGLLGVLGSIGPWTDELIPPDKTGLDGDGVLTVLTSAVLAACGLLILRHLGRLWVSIVALVCAATSLVVAFLDYADLQHLTHGIDIHGAAFYSVAWGLHLLLAASVGAVGFAIRAIARRGVIVYDTDSHNQAESQPRF